MNVELEVMWVADDDNDVDVDIDVDEHEEKAVPIEFISWECTSVIACMPLSCIWPEEGGWKLASFLLIGAFYA